MSGVEQLVREAVRSLPPYRGLTGDRPAVLLDGNENPLGPSPKVLERMAAMNGTQLSRYPAPQALRERWARELNVQAAEVLLTSGSGPAIALAAELVLGAGDSCVMAAPCFELYGWAAERREARVVTVACDPAKQFAFPAEGFRHAVEDAGVPPRLVIIGNPDNPTGTAPSLEFLETMASAHRRTLFLIDEAYTEFFGSSAIRLAVRLPNMLVARTFSKALGLAGERIGGLIGSAQLIELLARINVPYPITATAAALGLAALDDRSHVTATVKQSRRAVRQIAEGLTALGLPNIPTRANFVLCDLGDADRAARLTAALARRGVAIRNRSHLAGMAGWVRVSAGTDAEVNRFLDEMRLLFAPEPEALLFDMDGVLVDVRESYDEAIVRTVRSFLPAGREVSREAILSVKQRADANDDHDATCIALARLGIKPDRKEVERRFQALYIGTGRKPGLYRRERWLLPLRSIERLARRFPLAIVTGRTRNEVRLALRAARASRWFKAVITADDVRKKKPQPDVLRAALRKLKVHQAWVVGDGPADLLAAQRAGLTSIGVRRPDWTATADGVLREYQPLAVLERTADLLQVFDERDALAKETVR
ncbi:MAG: aminotransferase class I/II-fold pyridoxal phosphate-dependent enzyme [Gemmatimonadetes bacterium]|nr:aminotransferase class I/II-fold pyridoxal phosphate-dependent enzyme [Gemmatimonadota bacterium]